jgi:hypothetical protein
MQVKMHDYLAEHVLTALGLSQEGAIVIFVLLNTALEKRRQRIGLANIVLVGRIICML